MKKVLLVLVFLLQLSFSSYGESTDIKVNINGTDVVYGEAMGQPFIDEANRTQVPLRACLETLGADVSWDAATQTVIAERNSIEVQIPIGKDFILRNHATVKIDTEARIVDSRTYLPIRAVMEAFNCNVAWNSDLKLIEVTDEPVDYFVEGNGSSGFPATYDSRFTQGITPVKDQLRTGTCWAFSTTAVLESLLVREAEYDFSEDNMILNNDYLSDYSTGGSRYSIYGYLTSWRGPVLERDDAFYDYKTNSNASAVKHIQGIEVLDSDIDSLKSAILEHGAVQFTFYFDRHSNAYNATSSSYYYDGTNANKFNHSVALVGWDDTYAPKNFTNNPKTHGAFIAKNSFGEAFGDHGYFYISYSDYYVGHAETPAVVFNRIDNTDNYDHIYQHDFAGNTSSIGYGDGQAWFANVFEKQSSNEVLQAVSFYTEGRNSSYKISLIDNYRKDSDLLRGKVIHRGSIANQGYHTIDFDPIALSDNGRFAVIVEMDTPTVECPIAVEFPTERSMDVSSEPDQSYISHDGIHWTDVVIDFENTNVCLKAFTKIQP